MKEIFNHTTDVHDTDVFGIVRASCIQKYMQSAADAQLQHTHPTRKQLLEKAQAFVVSKIHLKMHSPLYCYDKIRVETWLYEFRGVLFNRVYKIFRENELVAEGNSIWGLIGHDGKILRATEWDCRVHLDTDNVSIPAPYRFAKFPVTEYREVGKKQVKYADIDLNGHMNNTVYPDMYCAYIPELHFSSDKKEKYMVSEIMINYASEAPLDEMLSVLLSKDSETGAYYFKTIRADGRVNTEAQITLKKV